MREYVSIGRKWLFLSQMYARIFNLIWYATMRTYWSCSNRTVLETHLQRSHEYQHVVQQILHVVPWLLAAKIWISSDRQGVRLQTVDTERYLMNSWYRNVVSHCRYLARDEHSRCEKLAKKIEKVVRVELKNELRDVDNSLGKFTANYK